MMIKKIVFGTKLLTKHKIEIQIRHRINNQVTL